MTVRNTTRATIGLAAAAVLSTGLLIVNTGAASARTPAYHHRLTDTLGHHNGHRRPDGDRHIPTARPGRTPTKFSVSASTAGIFVVQYQTDGYPALTTSVDGTYLGVSGNGPGTTETPSSTLSIGAHTIWCSEPDGFGTTYAYVVKVA